VFGFSPDGRGADVTQRLQAAAETYGYVILASNAARNGPWAPIYAAQDAMWKDAHRELNVDDEHVYALGFSGGARSAVAMAQRFPLRGVIACGAFSAVVPGLPEEKSQVETLIKRLPPLVYLAFGDLDPNAWEMHGADNLMSEHGVQHWSEEFIGRHEWPSERILTEAVEFMELDRRMPHDDSPESAETADFASRLASARMDRARELDGRGAPHLALHELAQAAVLFPSSGARAVLEPLLFHSEEWGAGTTALDTLDAATDAALLEQAWMVSETLAKNAGPLQRRAQFVLETSPDRALLRAIAAKRRGQNDAAETLLLFAASRLAGASAKPDTFYNLACAYAQLGHKEEALSALELAIAAGYHDRRAVLHDNDLQPVREDINYKSQFQKLAERL